MAKVEMLAVVAQMTRYARILTLNVETFNNQRLIESLDSVRVFKQKEEIFERIFCLRVLPAVEEEGAREATSCFAPSVVPPVSMSPPSSQVPGTYHECVASSLIMCTISK